MQDSENFITLTQCMDLSIVCTSICFVMYIFQVNSGWDLIQKDLRSSKKFLQEILICFSTRLKSLITTLSVIPLFTIFGGLSFLGLSAFVARLSQVGARKLSENLAKKFPVLEGPSGPNGYIGGGNCEEYSICGNCEEYSICGNCEYHNIGDGPA